jgi:integrase
MAIMAQCPICRRKQSNKNKKCKECGEDLDKAKRSGRVAYWITYRLNYKQRWEFVGFSIDTARASDGKRKAQRKENRVLDILVDSRITFNELATWYMNLKPVKMLKSWRDIECTLRYFNKTPFVGSNQAYGEKRIIDVKQVDIEAYRVIRQEQGLSNTSVDTAIRIIKTMVTKAFDNDMVDGHALKLFRNLAPLNRSSANERDRILLIAEYLAILANAVEWFKPPTICAMNTGMRTGEIQKVKWPMFNRYGKYFDLPPEIIKEKRRKIVPLNDTMMHLLKNVIRCTHHNFIFTNSKQDPYIDKSTFRLPFQNACEKAEIPYGRNIDDGCTFHDIRRTVKTNMVEAGMRDKYIDLVLGHTLPGMSKRYIKPRSEVLHAEMKKYSEWLKVETDKAVSKMESVNQSVNQVL